MVAVLFPSIVLIGKLASFWAQESYFGLKSNIFNRVFVKQGWFWTSLAFWASYRLQHPQNKGALVHATIRYLLATLWWILFTQWMVGPPLMDRIFVWTGGQCVAAAVKASTESSQFAETIATSQLCRKVGGKWIGGHDPSGHFFLLVHSSVFLLNEILPQIAHHTSHTEPFDWSVKIPLALVAFWTWMLLMTSIYFHSVFEKLTGLIFGYAEVYIVYYLGGKYPFGRTLGVPETKQDNLVEEAI